MKKNKKEITMRISQKWCRDKGEEKWLDG